MGHHGSPPFEKFSQFRFNQIRLKISRNIMQKSLVLMTVALGLGLGGLVGPTTAASAKTTYLPSAIRHHTFYRLTSGTEGGFHDKTTFKGNKISIHMTGGHYTWRLTGVKRHNAKTYYARLHYTKKHSEPIKIKIFNSKHFDFIPKHFMNLKGNYTGDESYGAQIFKR